MRNSHSFTNICTQNSKTVLTYVCAHTNTQTHTYIHMHTQRQTFSVEKVPGEPAFQGNLLWDGSKQLNDMGKVV